MTYQLGDPVHAMVRCPKTDCGLLLINGQQCNCTWRADTSPTDPLIGQVVIGVGANGRILASGTVTGVDRTGDDLKLTIDQNSE